MFLTKPAIAGTCKGKVATDNVDSLGGPTNGHLVTFRIDQRTPGLRTATLAAAIWPPDTWAAQSLFHDLNEVRRRLSSLGLDW